MRLEYAKSLYELGKVYLPSRETENVKGETEKKALRYLKEAAEIFKKAGAELWLKKVKKLIAELLSENQ